MINSEPNTTNRHDVNRTPRGSSAGSIAAEADFQVPLSVATQTGGSAIRPASFTGPFAMKPTNNAISSEGQKTCSRAIDAFGFFARSIEDLQLVTDVFVLEDHGPLEDIAERSLSRCHEDSGMERVGPGTVAAMGKAATILESCGVKLNKSHFPQNLTIMAP